VNGQSSTSNILRVKIYFTQNSMEAQVPSQKPDFARIVLGCKGLNHSIVNVNQV
jgi:hypothetical protein